MKKYGKKGFTLIELIAVLVIMAIIALIATPLVMSIIRKARVSADKRSVDAYGRSIELAIAGYLLDTGKFPTEVSQLTIEYSGNKVVCSTTQINTDSSVYLAGCTVAGRSTGDYTYGKYDAPTYTAYTVGDEVTYNNVDYYVINDSNATEDHVTLLKANSLSYDEVEAYSLESGGSFGSSDGKKTTGIQYGQTNSYLTSYVEIVVNAWAKDKVILNDTTEDSSGYAIRLLSINDLVDNLGFECDWNRTSQQCFSTEDTPDFVVNQIYWTMTPYLDSQDKVWVVGNGRDFNYNILGIESDRYTNGYADNYQVRPVITIKKSALSN